MQIYRAPVPLDLLAAAGQEPPLELALRLHIVLVLPRTESSLAEQAAARASQALAAVGLDENFGAVSVTVDSSSGGCHFAEVLVHRHTAAPQLHAWPCGLSHLAWDGVADRALDDILQARHFFAAFCTAPN